MRIRIRFEGLSTKGGAASRDERLQRVLRAARRTAGYLPFLKPAFTALAAGAAPHSSEALLALIRPVPAAWYPGDPGRFRSFGAPPQKALRLTATPRGLRKWLGSTPEQVEGPAAELASAGAGGTLHVGDARRIAVCSRLGQPLIAGGDRDRLWRAFQIPVFEQIVGFEGELLAYECEAHDGFHLEDEAGIFEIISGELVVTSLVAVHWPAVRVLTGLEGRIETGSCPCGAVVARFLPRAESGIRLPLSRAAHQAEVPVAAIR